LTTKQDLKLLETNMLNAVEAKAAHFEIKANNIESKIQLLESKMLQLDYRLTIKLGTLLVILDLISSPSRRWQNTELNKPGLRGLLHSNLCSMPLAI
jgi:hypothetical protein